MASRGSDLEIVDFAVVVGFDGSPGADDALAFGELLASGSGARLLVTCVYVCRPVVAMPSGERARATAARAGGRLLGRCRWQSLAVPALQLEDGLLAVAGEARAVAIVIGSSRRRRGRRTIAERLVRRRTGAAVVVAPVGFRARAAGLIDTRVNAR